MTNKIIFLCLAVLILLSCANFSAAEDGEEIPQIIPEVTQGACVPLKQLCTNCTYNNISSIVYYRNGTQLLGEVAMTKMGIEYNYTFCVGNNLGVLVVNGHGDIDGVDTPWRFRVPVNPTGTAQSTGGALFYLVILLIFFVSLVYTFSQTFKAGSYVAAMSYGCASYILLLSTVFFSYRFVTDFVFDVPYIGNILYAFLILLLIGLLVGFFVAILLVFRSFLEQKEIKKLTDRGYSPEEARRRLTRSK